MLNRFSSIKYSDDFNNPDKPFRYVVIDDFFDAHFANHLSFIYPNIDDNKWYKFREEIDGIKNVLEQGMYGISKVEDMPELWLDVFKYLNHKSFIQFLTEVTGINNILPDTYNDIGQWTGLRMMDKGSYQIIHSDARLHPHLNMEKKLTIVGYLNDKWVEEDSGYLELWNNDMTECVEKIEPKHNRIVLFENTETSYHGVPEVNNYRKSFLMSYLSDTKDFKETRPKALFVKRPYEKDEELIDKIAKLRANLDDY